MTKAAVGGGVSRVFPTGYPVDHTRKQSTPSLPNGGQRNTKPKTKNNGAMQPVKHGGEGTSGGGIWTPDCACIRYVHQT